jgi:hypothetical protein
MSPKILTVRSVQKTGYVKLPKELEHCDEIIFVKHPDGILIKCNDNGNGNGVK